VALALRDQPEINGKVRYWGRLEQRSSVDVFVTVATEGNRDLSGARIDRADEKSLVELAGEIAARAGKIRDGSARASRSHDRCSMRAVVAREVRDLALRHPRKRAPRRLCPGRACRAIVRVRDRDECRHVRHRCGVCPFVPMARCPMLILVPRSGRALGHGGAVEVRPVLRLCATFDHRIIDGAAAGRFAARLTGLFASPGLLA